ncbi:PGL/p-HBAD biosynthesis glycosyltransferase [Mycobacterium antarcticum]|nr:PGL/p-HBAD biosynthesis glycosyltransferase [Mycolicibacterium sp. TUM20985]GLP79576.1 PGL/p-HBAD biosynthesis glycosyltransferase [Mycolicibacterium sp. TUM20984]
MTRMPAAPLFSIIVPTLNVAATLRACLDSIGSQSCRDFELLMIDGGSSDATLDIANSYVAAFDGRLVIHSESDEGAYDAMNNGVAKARGAWTFFLGGDDTLYAPETLAKVADLMGELGSGVDLLYGDVILRSNSSRYAGVFDLDRLQFHQNICHQAIFYRRELFATIGPFNLRYPIWADWDFNIRCFSNPALSIRYMDLVIANFNDVTGLSQVADEEFKKRLPIYFWAPHMAVFRQRLAHWRRTRRA